MHPPIPRPLIEVDSTFGRIEAFADDLVTRHIQDFGAHCRPELAFLLSMVDTGDGVFDIGAHIGTFAIPLAQKVGAAGRIVAVEGLPETHAVLVRNLRRTAPPASVTVLNRLIAPPGCGYVASTPPGNTGANFFIASNDNPVAVAATTVDALSRSCFLPRVMKVDVEGFEFLALCAAPLVLAQRPIIYAEVAGQLLQRCGSSVAQLDALLHANHYRYFRNVGDRNAAHDEFVVAELPDLSAGGDFFDVLAVHRDDERIARLLSRSSAP